MMRDDESKQVNEWTGSPLNRQNLGFLLAKAMQRWNTVLYEAFCRHGYDEVRPAYGSILVPLFEEEGLRMGELAERADLSKQTMTTMVRNMEKRRLVERRVDPEDGRAFRIFLTDHARRFRSVAEEVLREMESEVIALLGAEGERQAKGALEELRRLPIPERRREISSDTESSV